jgi:hypothetical protein
MKYDEHYETVMKCVWGHRRAVFIILQGIPELKRLSPHNPSHIVTSAESKQFPVSNTSGCYWKTKRLGMLGGFQNFTLSAIIAIEAIKGVFCARRMVKTDRRWESYLVRPRHVSTRKIKKVFRIEFVLRFYTENYKGNEICFIKI